MWTGQTHLVNTKTNKLHRSLNVNQYAIRNSMNALLWKCVVPVMTGEQTVADTWRIPEQDRTLDGIKNWYRTGDASLLRNFCSNHKHHRSMIMVYQDPVPNLLGKVKESKSPPSESTGSHPPCGGKDSHQISLLGEFCFPDRNAADDVTSTLICPRILLPVLDVLSFAPDSERSGSPDPH